VDEASHLLEERGEAAFPVLRDRSSPYVYMNVSIFVLTMEGIALVDPAVPAHVPLGSTSGGRNLLPLQDAVGRHPVREMIEKLQTADSAWVLYLTPKPGEVKPSKKAAYVRKVNVEGRPLVVGAGLFLAAPIWMR